MDMNLKVKIFSDTLGTFSCDIEEKMNKFLAQDDIEIFDIKVSNSSNLCVVCIFYKLKPLGKWIFKDTDNVYIQELCCSLCGGKALYPDTDDYRPIESKHCPHCGSKMEL